MLAVLRSADLILIVIDGFNPQQSKVLEKEVREAGIRTNEKAPDVKIKKSIRGGLRIGTTVKLKKIDKKMIQGILRELGIINADVLIRTDITDDQLIDVVEGNRLYVPAAVVVNKSDLLADDIKKQIKKMIKPDLFISADTGEGLDELKELIFKKLDLIRIFLKEVGKKADMEEPLIMRKGVTIGEICRKLHRDFEKNFKFARIWGPSSKFPGQDVRKLDKVLQDKDILEIHMD